MPTKRSRTSRDSGPVNTAHLPAPGEVVRTRRPYVRGASGASRPEPDATYIVDGAEHRFDGRCHAACLDVR